MITFSAFYPVSNDQLLNKSVRFFSLLSKRKKRISDMFLSKRGRVCYQLAALKVGSRDHILLVNPVLLNIPWVMPAFLVALNRVTLIDQPERKRHIVTCPYNTATKNKGTVHLIELTSFADLLYLQLRRECKFNDEGLRNLVAKATPSIYYSLEEALFDDYPVLEGLLNGHS